MADFTEEFNYETPKRVTDAAAFVGVPDPTPEDTPPPVIPVDAVPNQSDEVSRPSSESMPTEMRDEEVTDELEVQKKKGRLGKRRLILVSSLAAGLFAVFVYANVWKDEAVCKKIVISGAETISNIEVLDKTDSIIGKKFEDIKLTGLEAAVEKINYIRKAVVTKELPSTIRIQIYERKPVAIAIIGGNLKVIDDGGNVIETQDKSFEQGKLILLTGFKKITRDAKGIARLDSAEVSDALEFLSLIRTQKLSRLLISEINVSNPERMYALTTDGAIPILLGNGGNYERKINYLEAFWKNVVIKKGTDKFSYIDVRYNGKVFAKEL
jgi:cell division protein FtsQ